MPQRPRRTRLLRLTWKPVVLATIVVALALAIAATRGAPPALGTIQPERTIHEFGTVRMEDGSIAATFKLTIDGVVDAVDLTTS